MNKFQFRKDGLKKLKSLSSRERKLFSQKVSKKLNFFLSKQKFKSILFYYPLSFEPDIRNSIYFWKRAKKDIFLPKIEVESFKMVKLRLPLEKSSFGTLESRNSKVKIFRVDIMVVPVIGVDSKMRRVGFGKGMYDRFFETLKNRPKVVFLQLLKHKSKIEIGEKHDIVGDYYFYQPNIKNRDEKT